MFKRMQPETQTGRRVKRLISDNEMEYVNHDMKRYFRQCGIRLETRVLHNPEQNGLAERMNRILVECARCLLSDAGLDKSFGDPKSQEGIFVGYAAGSSRYRVYNPRSRKVYVSRDVVFLQ